MHVHLPKPLHGWRDLLGEVGIIVVGVLIALAAEQIVEVWHEHNQAAEGRTALRAELGTDDLPQAYARLAVAPCVEGKLQELQGALDRDLDRREVAALARAYNPPLRTWDDQAWNAVVASGVLAHAGSRELVQWSFPYRMITVLRPRSEAERADTVTLRSISSAGGKLSPLERDRATVALEHLRSDEQVMVADSRDLIEASREAGVILTAEQKRQVMREVQAMWGSCVRVPKIERFDPESQFSSQYQEDHRSTSH